MSQTSPSNDPIALRKSGPLRVFLVEDSAIIRDRLTESLSATGQIEVVGYADTQENAIAALTAQPCDAVVLDLQLRQGNGLNVLRELRKQLPTPGTTFIVLTNYAFPQYRSKSLQLGADYFLDKARDYDRVFEVLEQLAAGVVLPTDQGA